MWFNPMMTWLIRSPFHSLVSKNMMLVSYTGRKSGKAYATPVNYFRLNDARGEYLLTTSFRERTWWRNLRGGGEVSLLLQGKQVKARAEAVEDEHSVAAELLAYLREAPQYARYQAVRLEADGKPNAEDVAKAAKVRVVVRMRLA